MTLDLDGLLHRFRLITDEDQYRSTLDRYQNKLPSLDEPRSDWFFEWIENCILLTVDHHKVPREYRLEEQARIIIYENERDRNDAVNLTIQQSNNDKTENTSKALEFAKHETKFVLCAYRDAVLEHWAS